MAEYITKDQVIEWFRPYGHAGDGIPYDVLAADIREMPAADVAPVVWIPVTERLPEDRSDVLVVAYWHERWGIYMGWCAPERAEWSVHIGIGDRNDVAVTHWMPLPEPPKGVADEAGFIHAEFLADDIPAVDAVPVVRCGGCEYSLSYCGYLVCSLSARSRNPKANYIVNPDFFCAHGKRKEST